MHPAVLARRDSWSRLQSDHRDSSATVVAAARPHHDLSRALPPSALEAVRASAE